MVILGAIFIGCHVIKPAARSCCIRPNFLLANGAPSVKLGDRRVAGF